MALRRIVLTLTLAATVAISATVLRAQSGERPANREPEAAQQAAFGGQCDWLCQLRQREAQQLEGSWVITVTAVTPPGRPTRINYTTFARGGVSVGSDRLAPFGGAQHGVWEHLGGHEFAWTFISDGSDAMGNYAVTLKVTNKLTMTGPSSFVGVNSSELRDAAGNVLLRGCNTLRGERLTIEPLAEACQSMTPPQ